MKKILFPTDFSNTSLNAFAYALHLAEKINAEIIALHVYELPSMVYTSEASFMMQHYNMSEWDEFENFKSEVPRLRQIAENENLGHIKISNILERGTPEEDVPAIAQREAVDYIVMGTTGATGLKEVFLGSTAQKVMSKSTAAVLVIPSSCRFKEFKKILFLTNFQKRDMSLLEKVYDFAEQFRASIDVMEIKKHHDEYESGQIAEWKAQFPHSGFSYRVIAANDYEETVLDVVANNSIDLIAIPIRRKNILEKVFVFSLSKQLAFHSKVPILSVHYDV